MSKTVLIVEDNELNMKLFHDLLEAHGIQTLETRDGNNVLDIAREKKPDLILMDIQLPEVSGLDVTKWLKADEGLKHIPVIAVTAFAMKGDEEKIREGGCEDYISKPISVMRFLETIQKHLNKPSEENPVTEDKPAETEEDEVSFEIQARDDEDDEEFLEDDEEGEDLPVKKETDL
jgi:two-component system cell cycle response regulator DivK